MSPSDIKYIVVHCSATQATADIGAAEIDQWHKARGWKKIGYHYVIRRDGKIEGGRALNEIGAHVHGYNAVSWGVCLAGGIDHNGKAENNFTSDQMAALHALLQNLKEQAPHAHILGHRDLSPDVNGDGIIESWEFIKECPSFDVRAWIAQNDQTILRE